MRVIVVIVALDLNASGRLVVLCMRMDDEEMRMNLADVTIVVMVRMNVLERRKKKSQQHGQACLDGDRSAHSLKVYRSGFFAWIGPPGMHHRQLMQHKRD